jgi:peptidoglycan/LPS O-acetylase OafA/YrhL
MDVGFSDGVARRATRANTGYRPDIDGLRAVAVLSVIGFHVTPRFVPGGYVGVDVFFVISGYLITGIVLGQLAEGRFSFAGFYARRVRRIFPALILVLVASAAIGWFVLVPGEFSQLMTHTAAAALFVPNIALWREAGYFDTRSELKPLLHLWSLGIEEQFYLIWPPLMYVSWKRGLNILSIMALIIVVSFAINVALARDSAAAAFFLPQARMWELLLGGLLAYLERVRGADFDGAVNRLMFAPGRTPDPRFVADAKAWSGLAMIGVAIAAFSRGTDFPGWWYGVPGASDAASFLGLNAGMAYPGWWAIAPTLGAALLISGGPTAWVNRRLLGRRPLVAIGLISYPLYMWHWPLLSYLQITENGSPSRGLRAAAVAASFVLATLTYIVVERPIRARR